MAKRDDIASVLAFEKKLVCSDGYMYGCVWDDKANATALKLKEKSVRGTISNRLKAAIKNDPMMLNAEVEKANLQRVDSCALEPEQDTLKLNFSIKVLGGIAKPSACNNAKFKQSYSKAASAYVSEYGFTELANRYAQNIANARFLWRNRIGVEQIEVSVNAKNTHSTHAFTFDATNLNTRDFDNASNDIDALSNLIATALASDNDYLLIEIDCFAQVGKSQEVYPSEELVLDKGKGDKSKVLYDVSNIAAMHSQKIGNALRTIDTWYPDFNDEDLSVGPIAIEPYGAVTNLGKAFRTPKEKQDFYTFFDKWARGESLERLEDEHYVMAVLVRGGVFGESDK